REVTTSASSSGEETRPTNGFAAGGLFAGNTAVPNASQTLRAPNARVATGSKRQHHEYNIYNGNEFIRVCASTCPDLFEAIS
ncbi:unnamed protein product, partial [Amoebophrya sp. A120]